jgi:peptidoglycan/LPS O-acetylase OafA/YrhL
LVPKLSCAVNFARWDDNNTKLGFSANQERSSGKGNQGKLMGIQEAEYRLGYRADIEGLRALAILLVVGAHAAVPGFSGGFVGVDVFFVLSGFLITGLLLQEVAKTGQLSFAAFYIRRLRRLLPALIVMLMGSGALAALVLGPNAQMPQALAGASAMAWLSNVHFALQKLDYFAPGTETNIFLHTWSLGVEEQFYLIWPALIYVIFRGRDARDLGRLRVAMVLVAVVSLAACIWATHRYPQMAFYMMPLRAWQFSLGALVWLEFRERRRRFASGSTGQAAMAMLGWGGLAMVLGAGCLLDANKPYPGLWALLPTVGAALVIASGSGGKTGVLQRLLSLAPLQAVGRVSYSWYLWHWPALLLGFALTGSHAPVYRLAYVMVSLMLAVASYQFIESPIRHQRWWMVHQRAATYTVVAIVAFSIVGMLRWYAYAGSVILTPAQQRIAAAHGDAPIIYAMGCDDWYRSDQVKPCVFGNAQATHTVVLMGDSIAGQWFPAVSKVFDRPDWRLLVLTKSSCPMVDESFFYARIGRIYTECSSWRKAILDGIVQIKPDIVLMASSDLAPFSDRQWESGTARVLQHLSSSGAQVYLLRATPHLPFDGPDCLAEHALRPQWMSTGQSCSAPNKDGHADEVYADLQKAASPFKSVHVLDMNDHICLGGICRAQHEGIVVFRDSQHMTAAFAASLASELTDRLQVQSIASYPIQSLKATSPASTTNR